MRGHVSIRLQNYNIQLCPSTKANPIRVIPHQRHFCMSKPASGLATNQSGRTNRSGRGFKVYGTQRRESAWKLTSNAGLWFVVGLLVSCSYGIGGHNRDSCADMKYCGIGRFGPTQDQVLSRLRPRAFLKDFRGVECMTV